MFDVSRRFLIVNLDINDEIALEEVMFENTNPIIKVKHIVELKANVLICGAISWPIEASANDLGTHVSFLDDRIVLRRDIVGIGQNRTQYLSRPRKGTSPSRSVSTEFQDSLFKKRVRTNDVKPANTE